MVFKSLCNEEINEFLWDVTNDPVIPYLVGLTPKKFRAFFENMHGPIEGIYIKLVYNEFCRENKEYWGMEIFEVF